MWIDDDLRDQIQGNYMLSSKARVIAEINLNAVVTPQAIGVYQYQPLRPILNVYDDQLSSRFFVREDLSDIPTQLIDKDTPLMDQYFSLKDCFTFRRPRAGIVYPLYFANQTKTYLENYTTAARPRNFIVGKNMPFKYWTSLKPDGVRTPKNISGTRYSSRHEGYGIANAAPAIIYNKTAYANKIVIKLQTHAGTSRGDDDPIATKWVPAMWEVQILNEQNQWISAYKFNLSYDIPTDGNIELMYGPTSPIGYEETFKVYGKIEFKHEVNKIPAEYLHVGMAYILNDSELYMWDGSAWGVQELVYGWIDGTDNPFQYTVDEIIDPDKNQFVRLKGVRLYVISMTQPEIPFDLIELSPRLQLDMTQYVDTYDIDKSLGLNTDLPISDLSNDVGSMTIINYNLGFSKLNRYNGESGSLIADYMTDHTKIIFYTAIKTDPVMYKYIPIKTMYVEYWPIADPGTGDMVVSIQDYFMFMDSLPAPDIFMQDVSLTYILSVLFDNVGITNYHFLGFNEFNNINIPFFFCDNQRTILDVLSDLVHAARCGIYFDEYNNLIVASKEYLSGKSRLPDIVLNGKSTDLDGDGDYDELANIESITIGKRVVYNDGDIVYSPKYIRKSPINMGLEFDIGQNLKFKYDPVTLWKLGEKNNENEYTSVNKNTGAFALSSVLLTGNLGAVPPEYDPTTGEFKHNIISVGISAWYLNRFAGYLYANGEIIRYDGVEYRITTNASTGETDYVWITSIQEYNHYVRNIPWNGWMDITGKVRIWTELENNKLVKHGRGYFKTPIVEHTVDGEVYWTVASNFESMQQEYKALFNPCQAVSFADWNISKDSNNRWVGSGKVGTKAKPPTFQLTTKLTNERRLNNIKASAMNWKGPTQTQELNNSTINYFRRPFEAGKNYQRFGCRMRIVGEAITSDNESYQQPDSILKIFGSDAAAGGLALFTDNKRQGYFLEVVAFREDQSATKVDCPQGYEGGGENLIFYKVLSVKLENGQIVSMPFKLWSAIVPLALDPGAFVLEDVAQNEVQSVVDIEVECYNNEFDIYYNGKKLGTAVDDVNTTILQNQKYFDESKQDQFNGDDNKNIIKSVPQFNKNSKFWGPFIRGDSRVLFENVWAAEYKTPTNVMETNTPDIFGEIELDNNYGTTQIDSIYRRHSLSGFVQKGMLQNFANNGYKYQIYYEEFGTILRECYLVDARYTDAYPTFYARILPTIDIGNPFAISQEQLGPYGTEFVIFNVADKSIVLEGDAAVVINGIVMSEEATGQITVDQFMRKARAENEKKTLTKTILESRRKNGIKKFATIDQGPYIQSLAIAENILDWALRYFTQEKFTCTASIFANPMIQLADIVEIRGLAGKTIKDGTIMIVESISYSHDSTGPLMSVGLREVL